MSATWEEEFEERLNKKYDAILGELNTLKDMVGACMGGEVKTPPKTIVKPQAPPKEQDGEFEYRFINTLNEGDKKFAVKGTVQFDPIMRETATGKQVTNLTISDGSGELKISFWEKHADEAMDYKKGDLKSALREAQQALKITRSPQGLWLVQELEKQAGNTQN